LTANTKLPPAHFKAVSLLLFGDFEAYGNAARTVRLCDEADPDHELGLVLREQTLPSLNSWKPLGTFLYETADDIKHDPDTIMRVTSLDTGEVLIQIGKEHGEA
jgi:hypothetical protein